MKTIIVTMRPNYGATGGPGGVVYLLKSILGDCVEHIHISYYFQPTAKHCKGYRDRINWLIFRFLFIFNPQAYYIVHDIETAKLLAKLHRKYSLVYHQQGPIIQEKLNFGEKLSMQQIENLHKTEKIAFENAVSVHFPSNGAANMYFKNENASCKFEDVSVGEPLYNTIPHEDTSPVDGLVRDFNKLTLFSLGSLTEAKGQDKTLLFIERLLEKTRKSIRYILVGDGPLQETLLNKCEIIKNRFQNFTYIYYPRLTHPQVMYVHEIADIYIMLHRISIFDFATLEAMQSNTAIVLSNVGGNVDFEKENNVILVDTNNMSPSINELLESDIDIIKKKNKMVFEKYFSNEAFKNEYKQLILKNIE